MESPTAYPESLLDPDEAAYPCKGCGEILEEGKAFELAGNRWHIDCFRCNTCGTLLDSDANLLLLGDGSLICNDCTYSCSSCGNKIEDLAILTGDQAFCANCFKCRNCKKKIENLRYARTSQGIFCMDCHEALMARRRKKTARNTAQRHKTAGNNALLDKSLPSLPPSAAPTNSLSPDLDTPPSETHSDAPTEIPPRLRPKNERRMNPRGCSTERREASPANSRSNSRNTLNLPQATNNSRHSSMSQRSEVGGAGNEEFLVPVVFDPTPPDPSSPRLAMGRTPRPENRDYFGNLTTAEPAARKPPGGSPTSSIGTPHIAYLERGRVPSEEVPGSNKSRRGESFSPDGPSATSPLAVQGQSRQQYATTSPKVAQNSRDMAAEAQFRLQEVPKTKRSGGSARSSRYGPSSPPTTIHASSASQNHGTEKQGDMFVGNVSVVQEPESFVAQDSNSPHPSQDYRGREAGSMDSSRSAQPSAVGQLKYPPKRGDSLESSKISQTIPRKEVGSSLSKSQQSPQSIQAPFSASATTTAGSDYASISEKANGGKVTVRPMGSPRSRSASDTSIPNDGGSPPSNVNGIFVASRVAPSAPVEPGESRKESMNSPQPQTSNEGEGTAPSGLPRWSAGGEFSMDEDMARILGGDGSQAQESFLRRVSNSVRHGRSFSDRGMRSSKDPRWPRSPNASGTMAGQEISSPSTASPEHRDELAWFKNELRRERQKAIERDQKIADLEATMHSQANIKQVNSELREKRSTIVVLDTRKEMVVRELEVLTEHIAAAKKSGDPLDLSKMRHAVMRDFAESLQKLKDSFSPQIEEFVQRRNDLVDELSNLNQMKDKSIQEFEQLSMKNEQLADLNNQLVRQIQELYKANSGPPVEQTPRAPNGLGIYSNAKDKSQVSVDSRETQAQMNEMSMMNSGGMMSSGSTLQPVEAEPITVLQGPHVVNIRKNPPKKFNWKKGGQNVAKGVSKGLKGAFSSTQASYSREMQFAETNPYGSTSPLAHDQLGGSARNGVSDPPPRHGFGLFGGNQKHVGKGQQPWKSQSNNSSPALTIDAGTTLFGSDLEARAEFERTPIPFIVTRCIEEVELRGMDVEGMYRKAGGASQVVAIKDGFESPSPQNFDISDPDLDIHAVSSTLKQYLRRLPNPLITYEVYDRLLETTAVATSLEAKVDAQAQALMELPKVHRDVLEFLVFHLKRVVGREKENLMTSMNVAVVFAPTIMRPESLAREMTDTQVKNEAVQFLVENCEGVFGGVHQQQEVSK